MAGFVGIRTLLKLLNIIVCHAIGIVALVGIVRVLLVMIDKLDQRFLNSTHIERTEAESWGTALSVMAGLVPAIHAAPFQGRLKRSSRSPTWMTGTSPVMTTLRRDRRLRKPPDDRCGI
jgi:hypothetical protein